VTAKKTNARKTTVRKAKRRKTARGPARSRLARVEQELPSDLREFARRVRAGLSTIERDLDQVQARTRRQGARLLREASHALGRFEAEGERRGRKLTRPARREALRLLRRLESALAAQ